jgi:two-component system chemotaxis sensor kinase CheA
LNDLRAKLLAAFHVEHKEYLDGIRAGLVKIEKPGDTVAAADVEEIFRLAHSLKAAARVCDFHTVEAIGQRLETLFAQVRKGTRRPSHQVCEGIRTVLNALEGWALAQAEGRDLPEPGSALVALDKLLGTGGPETTDRPAATDALTPKLLAAFQVEHKEHLEGIRSMLAAIDRGATVTSPEVDEAFRRAHSLKGAARLAELRPIETLAHRLETLFARVREGALQLDHPVQRAIHLGLDTIEDAAASLLEKRNPPEPGAALGAIERILASGAATPEPLAESPVPQEATVGMTPRFQPVETVRVSAENLDRLLRSTGQLLAENLRQNLVARELAGLSRQLADMEKEWEAVRNTAGAALRQLAAMPGLARVARTMSRVEHQVRDLARTARAVRLLHQRSAWSLGLLAGQVQQDVRRVRMVTAESVFQGFRKMMRDLARDEGKELDFRVSGLEVEADRMVLQALKDPLMHILCNAVGHGLETPEERQSSGKNTIGHVTLHLETMGNRLRIVVEDDGRGIDAGQVAEAAVRRGFLSEAEAATAAPDELIRLIFEPGFSTSRLVTGLAGRGMGLSVVHEAVARLQGEVEFQRPARAGTRLVLSVPLSVSTQRLLFLACHGQTFALPLHAIERLLRIRLESVEVVEGRPMLVVEGQPIPLLPLAHLLQMPQAEAQATDHYLPVVILRLGVRRVAVAVDAFLAERDSLIKDLDPPASLIGTLDGGILLEDGSVALVLNPAELLNRVKPADKAPLLTPVSAVAPKQAATVLVVDDSLTTRTLEKSLLEAHGYDVRIAMDGVEALSQLRVELPDLVITDIQMPRMDGFKLLEAMKQDQRLAQVPVIVVTSMEKREDQERGLALGADAYIVKRKFDHRELLDVIRQIL